MKDRNGVDIQDGDVVLIYEDGPMFGHEAEVKSIFRDGLSDKGPGLLWSLVNVYDPVSDMTETYPDWDIVMPRVFRNENGFRPLEIIGDIR